jgi:hypothetical protein
MRPAQSSLGSFTSTAFPTSDSPGSPDATSRCSVSFAETRHSRTSSSSPTCGGRSHRMSGKLASGSSPPTFSSRSSTKVHSSPVTTTPPSLHTISFDHHEEPTDSLSRSSASSSTKARTSSIPPPARPSTKSSTSRSDATRPS